MADTVDPARDCPPCPACGLELAMPVAESGQDRWDGPDDATLFCPSCGTGWIGTSADLERARKSWVAYEKEMESK